MCPKKDSLFEGGSAEDDYYFFDSIEKGGAFVKQTTEEWVAKEAKWLVHTVGEQIAFYCLSLCEQIAFHCLSLRGQSTR